MKKVVLQNLLFFLICLLSIPSAARDCGKAEQYFQKAVKLKDPQNPQKHGPYYQLSYSHKGKSSSEFIKKDQLTRVKQEMKNYAKFKQLTEQWVALAVQISKARKHLK